MASWLDRYRNPIITVLAALLAAMPRIRDHLAPLVARRWGRAYPRT